MFKSEVQHQFWITKKAVQQKLGAKEDKHVISSDAELDTKIEIFKSIDETSADLSKIIDQYQDRLCVLAQEECAFGRFLREMGKRSNTTGSIITSTGKAISYSGQQRLSIRVPLIRLQHEVEVFRGRAVRDTHFTITNMERERTEYRAALAWMKSASCELDPDTGKGLDKYRTAQSHVRSAKQHFDALSMSSIQKIDLLAASRCNMFSHALLSYMSELRRFAQKSGRTLEVISNALLRKPQYDFCVLKELTQNEGDRGENDEIKPIETVDKDQTLFFADDYADERVQETANTEPNTEDHETEEFLINLPDANDEDRSTESLLSQTQTWTNNTAPQHSNLNASTFMGNNNDSEKNKEQSTIPTANGNSSQPDIETKRSWLEFFSQIADPLINLETIDMKLNFHFDKI